MIKYIKNELKHLPMTILVFILLYGVVTIATSNINSNDITFDNTNSNLNAGDMQEAIDEVFQHATDYNEIKTTIGDSTLTTTNKTLSGGINELDGRFSKYEHIHYRSRPIKQAAMITTAGAEYTVQNDGYILAQITSQINDSRQAQILINNKYALGVGGYYGMNFTITVLQTFEVYAGDVITTRADIGSYVITIYEYTD